MVDLRTQYHNIKKDIDAAVMDVLENDSYINGRAVKEFTHNLAAYTHSNYVVPCANGTDAIQIAMMALELRAGDEVIVPVWTYVATAEVIALLGLKPIFADVYPDTFCIDIRGIEHKITAKTKAIVPVHLYGQCADMDSIVSLAKKHNLYIIEDTAQAIGSVYTFGDGTQKQAGTIGHIGTTSFYPSKNLGAFGDGGAIFTQDETLAKKMQMIAHHGESVRYHHDVVGCNSRLDTIQAAILNVKLSHLKEYEKRRNAVADYYDKAFSHHPNIKTPYRATNSTHVFHQYTLTLIDADRNALKEYLAEKNIPSMLYYPIPLHQQLAYKDYLSASDDFPISDSLASSVLSLPIHTEMDEEQLLYITDTLKSYFQ